MRAVKLPVDHYARYKCFFENIRTYFRDLGFYKIITTGKWIDETNHPTGSFRPFKSTQQISRREHLYLDSRAYHFIVAYINKTILDPNIKSHFDLVTKFTTIEKLEGYPRKRLKNLEQLCSANPMCTLYAGLTFFLPLRQISLDSPFTNELIVNLQRSINLMQTTIDNKYPTDNIRTIAECKDVINKR